MCSRCYSFPIHVHDCLWCLCSIWIPSFWSKTLWLLQISSCKVYSRKFCNCISRWIWFVVSCYHVVRRRTLNYRVAKTNQGHFERVKKNVENATFWWVGGSGVGQIPHKKNMPLKSILDPLSHFRPKKYFFLSK